MSKDVDSDVLALANRMLRLAGSDSGPVTTLETDSISQVLDVAPVVRRSLALPGGGGIMWCYLQNAHTDVEEIDTDVDPYNMATATIAPYPVPIPNTLEFYILTAAMRRSAGAGALTSGGLFMGPSPAQQGWGVQNGSPDTSLTTNNVACVAAFDSIRDIGGFECGIDADGNSEIRVARRVPRGAGVRFASTSAATATYQLILLCALLPLGFGQDVLY